MAEFPTGLLKYGIDAWWQDATEPENDDLQNRRINREQTPGEVTGMYIRCMSARQSMKVYVRMILTGEL